MYEGRNVVIAGGTGPIGIPLTKQLIERGANVTVVSLENHDYASKVLHSKAKFVQSDLVDINNCNNIVKNQDMVFNLMGIRGSVGIGETKVASQLVPMLRFQTNLMEAAFNAKIDKFLFVGSINSYPQSDIHFEENMWNGMPKQNDRIMGIAKRVGELLGESYYLEHNWEAVRIVRPSSVYGPFDAFPPKIAHVIPSLISRVAKGENPLIVWGNGMVKRDFIFSEDVAFWMLEAMEKAPPCYPINLGSGIAITIKEIAETIISIMNPNISIKWDDTKSSGDPCRLMSMKRAKSTIGFYPKTPLEQGLIKTINWYLNK